MEEEIIKEKRICKKWTTEEVEFLKEYYPGNGAKFCADKLNRKVHSIQHCASRIGLPIDKNTHNILNSNAQKEFNNNRSNDSFNVNVEQFLNIETKEVAYFLGYLWADGYVLSNEKRNEVRLEILNDDLLEIKCVLDKIGVWIYSSRRRNNRTKTLLGSAITSNRRLVNFLLENDYRVKCKETADKILSKIPNELKYYFFRGLIDGDGCFCIRKEKNRMSLSISSSYEQDWTFVQKLCLDLKINSYIYRTIVKEGKHSSIEMNGKNCKIFGDYIYQGINEDKIGLTRKYEKYLKAVEIFNNSKENVYLYQKLMVLKMYQGGKRVIDIIKELHLPPTTVRRWIKNEHFILV